MSGWKVALRNLLGLILIISSILSGLCILMDAAGVFAYFNHEQLIASQLFHESFYILVFFVPPYFIGKYINKADIVKALEEYRLLKSHTEG